jgi:xylulokinase
MTLALGFDVGTQSTKGVLIDLDRARVIARASRSYGLIEGLPAGHAEQHPDTWWEALVAVQGELRAAASTSPDAIVALGVSGQQHGAVLLDGEKRVLRPAKLWCDTSSAEEAAELSRRFGRPVAVGFTASKLLWSQVHEPELWARVATVLLPHDEMNRRLTGRVAMEAGDASGTGLLDPRTRDWARDDCRALDPRLLEMLPAVLPSNCQMGELTSEAAAQLGLREGLPVAAGGGDNMMSAIGAGATRPGPVVMSLGTSGTVFARSETPVIDPSGAIASFCDSAGAWLPLLCVMNCTGLTEEIRQSFGVEHEELARRARAVGPGSRGLRWLPFLSGERVPDLPEATGTLLGMRLGWLDPGLLYRAALEGVSLNLAAGVDRLRACGVAVEEVRLVGGGGRSQLWREILAACLGVPVVPLLEMESAALGAGLQAAWSAKGRAATAEELDALVAPFVQRGADPVVAPADAVRAYRELGAEFADALRHQYGT